MASLPEINRHYGRYLHIGWWKSNPEKKAYWHVVLRGESIQSRTAWLAKPGDTKLTDQGNLGSVDFRDGLGLREISIEKAKHKLLELWTNHVNPYLDIPISDERLKNVYSSKRTSIETTSVAKLSPLGRYANGFELKADQYARVATKLHDHVGVKPSIELIKETSELSVKIRVSPFKLCEFMEWLEEARTELIDNPQLGTKMPHPLIISGDVNEFNVPNPLSSLQEQATTEKKPWSIDATMKGSDIGQLPPITPIPHKRKRTESRPDLPAHLRPPPPPPFVLK